jgi:hypothetical protein
MNETQKTPATSILRKPIPIPFVWIALTIGFVLLLLGSPHEAFRLFAKALVYGVIAAVICACRKLLFSKRN